MSTSTIVSRFGTFTITTSETSIGIIDHLGVPLASLTIPELGDLDPDTHDRIMPLYLAAVNIVNTKIKDLSDAQLHEATTTQLQNEQLQLENSQSQLEIAQQELEISQQELEISTAMLRLAEHPPTPQLSSFQRASLVSALKGTNQLDSIIKEVANPTAIPGLPIPPDIKKF